MATLRDLERLKRQSESLRTEIDQAKGALDVMMKALKSEFNVGSLKEAERLLEKMRKEEQERQEEFEEAFEEFNTKWGERLEQ